MCGKPGTGRHSTSHHAKAIYIKYKIISSCRSWDICYESVNGRTRWLQYSSHSIEWGYNIIQKTVKPVYTEHRLHKMECCKNRTLNKVLMCEIFVNLTYTNWRPVYSSQKLVTRRFDLGRFHCTKHICTKDTLPEFHPMSISCRNGKFSTR